MHCNTQRPHDHPTRCCAERFDQCTDERELLQREHRQRHCDRERWNLPLQLQLEHGTGTKHGHGKQPHSRNMDLHRDRCERMHGHTERTITQPAAALNTSISAQTNVLCYGNATGTATVVANAGTPPYTFSWNTTPTQNTATATGLTAGTWTCTVTDANGCTATRNITITQPATALTSSLATQTNVNCFGNSTGSATVAGNGGTTPYNYSWNTTPAQNTATANNLSAGTWTCTITDANGCTTVRNVTITQPGTTLSASLASQTNVNCFGNGTGSAAVSVSGGTPSYTFNWNTTPPHILPPLPATSSPELGPAPSRTLRVAAPRRT